MAQTMSLKQTQSNSCHGQLIQKTLSSISEVIMALNSSNRWLSWSIKLNGVPGFNSWQNGSIHSAKANAYDTWLIMLTQDHISVMFYGSGKLVLLPGVFCKVTYCQE